MPHPAIGDQAAPLDIRHAPQLAQDMVAGLESPSGQGVCLRRRSKK